MVREHFTLYLYFLPILTTDLESVPGCPLSTHRSSTSLHFNITLGSNIDTTDSSVTHPSAPDLRVRSTSLNIGCYLNFHVADCLAKRNFHTVNLALFLQFNEIDARWNGNYRFHTVFRFSTAFL